VLHQAKMSAEMAGSGSFAVGLTCWIQNVPAPLDSLNGCQVLLKKFDSEKAKWKVEIVNGESSGAKKYMAEKFLSATDPNHSHAQTSDASSKPGGAIQAAMLRFSTNVSSPRTSHCTIPVLSLHH
jgi:hypothetical protein